MSNKQSSVEWLVEQLKPAITLQEKYINEFLEQAKAMHKDEILNAHTDGFFTPSDYFDPDNYYNVIFNNNE